MIATGIFKLESKNKLIRQALDNIRSILGKKWSVKFSFKSFPCKNRIATLAFKRFSLEIRHLRLLLPISASFYTKLEHLRGLKPISRAFYAKVEHLRRLYQNHGYFAQKQNTQDVPSEFQYLFTQKELSAQKIEHLRISRVLQAKTENL